MTHYRTGLVMLLSAFLLSCGGGDSSGGSISSGDVTPGVGSGGTGVTTARAVSIGSVDGFGSIIVNGVRWDISSATASIADEASLQFGMTARVEGTADTALSTGTASQVTSAADLRGTASNINTISGTLTVMGVQVSTDEATVYDGLTNLAGLANGDPVQIYGLPGAPGSLRATRIEKLAASAAPVVSGAITNLNIGVQTFVIGGLSVNYAAASFTGSLSASTLANGQIVRVRATLPPAANILTATQVEPWYAVPTTNNVPVALEDVITNYTSLGSFTLLGVPIDASSAQITGGPSDAIGNGVKVEVSGAMENGVLVVTQLKILKIPGTGGPAAFSIIGTVGNYVSVASFRVQGHPVDASGNNVIFANGNASMLANGVKVTVTGSQVTNGVLIASQVTFN
jgi:hypothetical protein